MVENRKLFYAISLMLLTCCQIITMLPHNVVNSESSPVESSSNSTENNHNKTTNELKDNSPRSSSSSSSSYKRNTNTNNNNDNSDFLIIASATPLERKADHHAINTSEGVWVEGQENDSRPIDNIDDLIFLDKRPINQEHHHHHHHQQEQREKQLQHQQYDQQQHHHHHHHLHHQQQHNLQENENSHYKFHHITMDGGNSNSDEDIDSLTDTTYSTLMAVDDEQEPESESEHDGTIPHEIELQPDINEDVTPLNVTPLDLSDFLSLIPAAKVKAIVNHYYHNDPEVQRAHAFMSSRDFLMLKQHIIAIPEMSAFLRYLNNSGLDLVKFVTALTNLTAYNSDKYDDDNSSKVLNSSSTVSNETSVAAIEISGAQVIATTTFAEINDIEFAQNQSVTIPTTISNIETHVTTITIPSATITDDINVTTTTTMATKATTVAKEQLNGLHGLVDSVLDVLPQDQILATFFDKLEANEQFSKLVDNIGSPEFAKILNNMQNSIPLRNLIFTLHNNGIYVIRIVDSLKSYFFLGGF